MVILLKGPEVTQVFFFKFKNIFQLYLWPFSHTYVKLNVGFKPKKPSEEKSDLSRNFSNSFSSNYIDHCREYWNH